MPRTGSDLDGYRAALDLLLNEEAYLAWCEGRDEEPLPLERRRELADFLSVVSGDGTFHGSMHRKREMIGDGSGWAAPSTAYDDLEVPLGKRMWHAIEVPGSESRRPDEDWQSWVLRPSSSEPMPACGQGRLRWGRAVPVNEMPSTAPRCTKSACQQRLVGP